MLRENIHMGSLLNSVKNVRMIILAVIICAGLAGQALAATTYYWQSDITSTSVGIDGYCTLTNGYSTYKHPGRTTFTTTSPSNKVTYMQENSWTSTEVSDGNVRLGRVYKSGNYSSATKIVSASGSIYDYSNSSSPLYLVLVDYNPSGVQWNGTAICSASVEASYTAGNKSFTMDCISGGYTVAAGHRLALDVFYSPSSTSDAAYIAFNKKNNYLSWISAGESTVSTTHTITVSAGTGGTITLDGSSTALSGSVTVSDGESKQFDITANSGYAISDVSVDGVSQGAVSTYTFDSVTADHTITASFVRQYTITASAGTGGTISPSVAQVVNAGSSATYTITPNSGYAISDVVVNGVSVGAVSSYTFTSVSQDTTIVASFVVSVTTMSSYCSLPPFIPGIVPPNVMIMLSVETPMQGAAYPDLTCTGSAASTSYSCSSNATYSSGRYISNNYVNATTYSGYFDSSKCYTYSGSGSSGLFTPSSTSSGHTCGGTAWSGNFLNFATTMALDGFRLAFTGGNRDTDVGGSSPSTVLLGGRQMLSVGNSWYPIKKTTSAASYTPFTGTIYIVRHADGFSVCSNSGCTVSVSGLYPVVPSGTTTVEGAYTLRVKVCDPSNSTGLDSFCNSSNNKPEGILQQYATTMRFGLMSYAMTNNATKTLDGGILRSNVKWIRPTIPYGVRYHNSTGILTTCATASGCDNPEMEINTDGTFVDNPDGASGLNSGVINYINKFGYNSGYKSYDPISELYYQVVRHIKNLTPSPTSCTGMTTFDDGFVAYCSSTKPDITNGNSSRVYGWRDPFIYPCSQSAVIGIQDANPWLDKRIPGTAFTAAYGSEYSGVNDYCNSSYPCDTDISDLSSTNVPSGSSKTGLMYWTDKIGENEKFATDGIDAGCVFDGSALCTDYTSSTKYTSELSRIVGTAPSPGKENSYYIAGLAYYAHMTDLRPDLTSTYSTSPHTMTSYFIDTQEPNSPMLVGKYNMLYLAAKYGGFKYSGLSSTAFTTSNMPVPYTDSTCGTSSAASGCSKWDSTSSGFPDNYTIAQSPGAISSALNKSFTDILKRLSSGTAASILNNSQGSGATLMQAMFYPQKTFTGTSSTADVSWIGEIHSLWYYIDTALSNISIREDTVANKQLNLTNDNIVDLYFDNVAGKTLANTYADANGDGVIDNSSSPVNSAEDPDDIASLWRAGKILWARDLSSDPRTIYTGYNSTSGSTPQTFSSSTFNSASAWNFLQIPSGTSTYRQSKTSLLVNYILGTDISSTSDPDGQTYRSRTVPIGSSSNVWKLGDIISSTPKLVSNIALGAYNSSSPNGYGDTTYTSFLATTTYKKRGMVFVGANDGMLHAFKLGILKELSGKYLKAEFDDSSGSVATASNLGREEWAFIPTGALPYLKYYSDSSYNHLYYVDRTPTIVDASIGSCSSTDYSSCTKSASTWRTVLVGGMGLGGASRISTGSCIAPTTTINGVSLPNCIISPISTGGLSSYFALDVTDPANPLYLWEFSGSKNSDGTYAGDLGASTTGPAIIRLAYRNSSGTKDNSKNGRWFAVFASGPTGPVYSGYHYFMGQSDQTLKLFIVDLADGTLVRTIDTGITNAFAGTLTTNAIDTDKWNSANSGYYSDDVVYIGYVQKDTTLGTWTKGGVLRLTTSDWNDPNATNSTGDNYWNWSYLIKDIGPVTTSVVKLQDRANKLLWIYFGTGRYYYNGDDPSTTTTQELYGVKEPCYNTFSRNIGSLAVVAGGTVNHIDGTCSDAVPTSSTYLKDQSGDTSTLPSTTLSANASGWYVKLDAASSTNLSERLISDPVASSAGTVYFTTFVPILNPCSYGGSTYVWSLNYSTGSAPASSTMKGSALLQVSTGAFSQVSLSSAFSNSSSRLNGRRTSTAITGVPPTSSGLSLITNPSPVKKIIHVREK
jgi:Tfp pilus tip-associated adhesin PilY1